MKTTAEWVERLRGDGVNVDFATDLWRTPEQKELGEYAWGSDQILIAPTSSVATLFHELSHWTGHRSRLARPIMTGGNWASSQCRGREELIVGVATINLSYVCGFRLTEECEKYHKAWQKCYPSEDVREDALAASSYLIHRFGL